MTAAEAQIAALQRRIDADLGSRCGPGGSLSGRRNALARGTLICGRSRATACGAPARQPGQHRRAPRPHVGRRPGRHCGATDRVLASPARGTGVGVIQAAGLARGTRISR